MCLYRTISEMDGDFSRKLPNFPTPVYFAPSLTELPLELDIVALVRKTGMMGLPDG